MLNGIGVLTGMCAPIAARGVQCGSDDYMNTNESIQCPRCSSFKVKKHGTIPEMFFGSLVGLGSILGCLGCLFFPLMIFGIGIIIIVSPVFLILKLIEKNPTMKCSNCHFTWKKNHIKL